MLFSWYLSWINRSSLHLGDPNNLPQQYDTSCISLTLRSLVFMEIISLLPPFIIFTWTFSFHQYSCQQLFILSWTYSRFSFFYFIPHKVYSCIYTNIWRKFFIYSNMGSTTQAPMHHNIILSATKMFSIVMPLHTHRHFFSLKQIISFCIKEIQKSVFPLLLFSFSTDLRSLHSIPNTKKKNVASH